MITFNSEYSNLTIHTEYNYDSTVFYIVHCGVKLVIAKGCNE